MSRWVPLWVYPAGTLWASWTWLTIYEVFSYYLFNYFLGSFLSFSSGTPIMQMLVPLMLSQRLLWLSSFSFFHSFFYILFRGSDFHHSVLQVTYSFFCLSYSATDSFQCIVPLCLCLALVYRASLSKALIQSSNGWSYLATHSSFLAWRILWPEEPGRPQSMGSQRVGHGWATNTTMSEPFFLFLKNIYLFVWAGSGMFDLHLRSCNYSAHVPQLLKLEHPRAPAPQREKPLQWEARVLQWRVALSLSN